MVTSYDEAQSFVESVGYPLVVKPSDLASSAFVQLVDNDQQLASVISEIQSFEVNFREQKRDKVCLLEEQLIGPEYSVEAFTYDGETTIIGITDKSLTGFPYFIEDGHMFPANISPELEKEIINYVKDVLEAVNHDHGISHTEVKVTKDGVKLIEINPRPGGNFIAELIGLVTDVDILELHINFALGKAPSISSVSHTGSAAVKFIVPEQAGLISAIEAPKEYEKEHVHRFMIKDVKGKEINSSIDNSCYLGHVITKDSAGKMARDYAESFVANTSVQFGEA
jgi:argininosuccinate lyase